MSNKVRNGKHNKYLKRRIAVAVAGIVVIAGVGFGIKSLVSNKANKEALASAKEEETKKEEEKPKPTDIMPNGNIIYAADSYAVSADEVEKMLEGKASNNDKEIFLTFDDGPS